MVLLLPVLWWSFSVIYLIVPSFSAAQLILVVHVMMCNEGTKYVLICSLLGVEPFSTAEKRMWRDILLHLSCTSLILPIFLCLLCFVNFKFDTVFR